MSLRCLTYYELGDHNVPKNWAQYVVKRDKGETPGPPIIWSDPQIPDDAVQMPDEQPLDWEQELIQEWEQPWPEFEEQVAPFICIMPPMPPQPPEDEIIDQPIWEDQPVIDDVTCDVTAIDYCGNFSENPKNQTLSGLNFAV